MYIYLPVAHTSVNILIPIALGLSVGLLSGLFGVGGGFLMTPLLIMLGIPSTVAAATDSNQIVAASTSGTYAHWKLGNVDFKMGSVLLAGGFAGGLVGVEVIKVLKAMGNADFVIKLTYVLMLGIVGSYMFAESVSAIRKRRKKQEVEEAPKADSKVTRFLASLPFQTEFKKSGVTHSYLVPGFFGIFVGLLAAVMGVGGGFLLVPIMVYMLRMPMHVVVGTSLFQILFNCIEVTFLQAFTNHTVDFMLALLLLVGSTLGAQVGTIFGRKLKGEQLKILLAILVLAVTVKMITDLTLTPDLLLGPAGGHGG
ncbi:MAG: sulfite exporter TauE/SafE family protein [Thermoleophilia bacterium]